MSNFSKKIKLPTDEEKSKIYNEILQNTIIYRKIYTKQSLLEKIDKNIISKLSDDELNAIMILTMEMSRYVVLGEDYFTDRIPERKRMVEFLCKDNNFDNKNVLTFINAITHDMRECRKYTLTNRTWEFHIKRIFEYLDGKNPYKIYEDLSKEEIQSGIGERNDE